MIHFLLPLIIVATSYPAAGPPSSAGEKEEPSVGRFTATQLIVMLRTDKRAEARRAALGLLEFIGPRYRKCPAAVTVALKEDSEESVREAAAQVLGKLAQRAHEIKEKELRDGAVETRDGALAALRAALQNDKSPRVREAAASALGRVGADDPAREASLLSAQRLAVPVLIAALKDTASGTRAAAAESLGRLGQMSEEAVPALVETFKDRKADRFVRGYAAFAIGRIDGGGARAAVPALGAALVDAEAPVEVRRSAAEALRALGTDAAGATEQLGQALKDKSVAVRRTAAAALGQVGPEARAALPALEQAARDQDKFVRAQVLHVLGGLPQDAARVVPLLLDGMKDQLLDVRLAAIEAFARLGPEAKDAIPVLTAAAKNDSQGVVRDAAAEALKKIQPNP